MPSTGFYPFLHKLTLLKPLYEVCQCPQRASIHFYKSGTSISGQTQEMCQCPQRASIHFYALYTTNGRKYKCVNALNGLLSISTKKKSSIYRKRSVSMPSTGFYPFLLITQNLKWNALNLCQCPQRASIHFYIRKYSEKPSATHCVNDLNGLLSISTHR